MKPRDPQFEVQLSLPEAPEGVWVRNMREQMQETGEVRTQDVTRLLGDPGKAVYMRGRDKQFCAAHSVIG